MSLKDVARRAGVSIPTASRVLSGSSYPVVAELRRRVQEAARELDYVPNAQARSLIKGTSGIIGVLAGDVGDPYFSEIVNGIHDVALEKQLLVTICHTERDVDEELAYFRMLQEHRAAIVILAGSGLDDERYRDGLTARVKSFIASGGRVVAIGSPSVAVEHVRADNAAGAVALARYLVSLGHRNVGILAGHRDVGSTAERVNGLAGVFTSCGGEVHVRYGQPTRDDAYAGAEQLMGQHSEITALIGSADQMGIGALSWLAEHGHSVPSDVSVAGFNDISVSRDLSPSLTTVRLPLREMGAAALSTALEPQVDAHPRTIVFRTDLIVRESTGHVRG